MLKIGDVVKLNSGGPRMTVCELRNRAVYVGVMARCEWLAADIVQDACFPSEAIRLDPEDDAVGKGNPGSK